jgi:methionyl-tRNA formyltransferase
MKPYYKNILVISDNPSLCFRFCGIISVHQWQDTAFSFAISPFSDPALFDVGNHKVKTIDLRQPDQVADILKQHDLVFSIHCKQIFPPALVSGVKCINVHPGYNPVNRGWYPQVFAILHKLEIGATIHEIDNEVDHGPIIARELVPMYPQDTSGDLYNRILDKEIEMLGHWLQPIVGNNYEAVMPGNEGNLYLKKDFNALLALDVNEPTTMGDAIDKLRALTHGTFNNAYFIDSATGKKIYVRIQLTPEEDE